MSVSIDQRQEHVKVPRSELVGQLVERDGLVCQYPGEEHELDLTITEGPREVTIDHHIPQWYCKKEGWTNEQIWAPSNLKLMCKRHNAKKGDRIPNADGTLPDKAQSTFRFRRQKRAGRPELCGECDNGHNLFVGEVCANCGCNAQRFPRWAKVKANECSHDVTWCWACSIGIVDRVGAIEMIMLGGEGGSDSHY